MKTLIRLGRLCLILSLLLILASGLAILKTASYAAETPTDKTSSPSPLPSQPSPTAGSAPTISIITPANNSVVPEGDITVSVRVANFNGNSKLSGYIFYFKDVEPPTGAFVPATTAPDTFIPTTETSYTWSKVTPGTHTFAVLLVNRDFTPLMPLVVAKITLKVVGNTGTSAPGPAVTPPTTTVVAPSTTQARVPTAVPKQTSPGPPATPLTEPVPERKAPALAIWIITIGVLALGISVLLAYNLRKGKP